MNEPHVKTLVVDAGTVLTPHERFSPGRIIVRNGQIHAAGLPSDVAVPSGAHRLESPDLTVTPGFIEPHIHGSAGVDVMDATRESLNTISQVLPRHGTTSFLPTTVSATSSQLDSVIARLGRILSEPLDGANPLGLHLEGPFINAGKRGAHDPEYVRPPDPAALSRWIELSGGTLRLVTMAPELQGAQQAAEIARAAGVVVGMGHSDASFEEAQRAAAAGTRYAVHTFNAMRPFAHRDPGIVGAVLADDRIFAEIIADGVHVDPEVIRIFFRVKGARRVILVTDAMSATGMPDGSYSLGNRLVKVSSGTCRDEDGRLAGSTLTQDAALRNFILWSGAKLQDAVLALTANPAEALKLEGRGRIEPGAHADLTMLDNHLQVIKTIIGGRLVYDASL